MLCHRNKMLLANNRHVRVDYSALERSVAGGITIPTRAIYIGGKREVVGRQQ